MQFSAVKLTPRAWDEFLDAKSFSLPNGQIITTRVSHNLERFQGNYIALIALILLIASFVSFAAITIGVVSCRRRVS
jgi:hypothetical protein